MFLVKPLNTILEDQSLTASGKQLAIFLYQQMLINFKIDLEENEIALKLSMTDQQVHNQLMLFREKGYIVGPNKIK